MQLVHQLFTGLKTSQDIQDKADLIKRLSFQLRQWNRCLSCKNIVLL